MRRMLTLFCAALILFAPLLLAGRPAAAGPQGKLVYIVAADIVRGLFQATGTVCVQTNVFKLGEEVVWRVTVFDASNGADPAEDGKNLTALTERGIKVTVYLENGMSFPLRYARHPGKGDPAAWLWATGWRIPDDFPTGRLKWWLVVTDKTGAFVRFDPIGFGTNLGAAPLIIEKR
ncbi:MAG TPA: hypothetical protein VFJ45_12475 [bacterium]|nr:hypothetical protein [bacterium]